MKNLIRLRLHFTLHTPKYVSSHIEHQTYGELDFQLLFFVGTTPTISDYPMHVYDKSRNSLLQLYLINVTRRTHCEPSRHTALTIMAFAVKIKMELRCKCLVYFTRGAFECFLQTTLRTSSDVAGE